jgi:hypothetical protein
MSYIEKRKFAEKRRLINSNNSSNGNSIIPLNQTSSQTMSAVVAKKIMTSLTSITTPVEEKQKRHTLTLSSRITERIEPTSPVVTKLGTSDLLKGTENGHVDPNKLESTHLSVDTSVMIKNTSKPKSYVDRKLETTV